MEKQTWPSVVILSLCFDSMYMNVSMIWCNKSSFTSCAITDSFPKCGHNIDEFWQNFVGVDVAVRTFFFIKYKI